MSRKRFLCIAYAFPPINRSGTHRTLGFVRELEKLGWDATVVTVEPTDEPTDDALLALVPARTRIMRTSWVDAIQWAKSWAGLRSPHPAGPHRLDPCEATGGDSGLQRSGRRGFRDWFSQLLMTPDTRIGWIKPAVRAGLCAVKRDRPDVIYSTSPYMSAHLIARRIARRTKLPWVADFRDPWRGNPYRRLRSASLDRWDAYLERSVLRRADRIVCCTPTMTAQLRGRVPFTVEKSATVLNGIDPELLANIESRRIASSYKIVFAHCGQFYGPRSPVPWFRALRRTRDSAPETAQRILFLQIGSDSYNGRSLWDWAGDFGVRDHCRILGQRPRKEVLSLIKGSDGLVLATSTGPGAELQIPQKLFEYLAVHKPILAGCVGTSPIRDILYDARAECYICDSNDADGLAVAMLRIARGDRSVPEHAWSGVTRYERSHRAAELVGIFENVFEKGRDKRSRDR